ncbi:MULTISPECIES: site-specific integrase [unclassified Mesorhizobium]|uniref:tyrosine-type recombinase/integrase n=1 Tax=unclassified Mesorhizobium TaxID=325217 RepID=UPI00109297C3|nr:MULTISPECIES: site-specific integrase [unclassified Mesorhizobium]TGP88917.1 site-specific integrase [Mesorhizobium sp. M8A.F.Ca.ET.218.01.1.1]TGT16077.1 site-specific integrase [Mesorhizobium sp. M8A.F.Ca.ET.213.01.1.1]
MALRKRILPSGKIAWLAEYRDGAGARRFKQFELKKDADAYLLTVRGEVRDGKHVAARASTTVAKAAELWLKSCDARELERASVREYKTHVRKHIVPLIGASVLSKMTVASIRAFEDAARDSGCSAAMVKRLHVSLSSIFEDARERGLVAHNPVRDMRRKRGGKDAKVEKRQKRKVQAGVDFPLTTEVKAIVGALDGRWRPLLLTAIFTGLRASELRGLRWQDVDTGKREIHVRQRADRWNDIGSPKSDTSERDVPLPPLVANTLREWKLACPKGKLDLVFPNGEGNVERLANIVQRGFCPAQVAAGVVVTGEDGEPKAKYGGMHALRHFYASWCANRKEDGGLGLPMKTVQERLGHSTILITAGTYAHLFPRGDDASELDAGVAAILG